MSENTKVTNNKTENKTKVEQKHEHQNNDSTQTKQPNVQEKIKQLELELKEKNEQIAKLSAELNDNKTKAASYLNTASYYKNEAENCKKDFERYKERNKNIEIEAKNKANELVAKKLLPILDSFDQAISKVDAEVMRGFSMIYASMQNILTELGVVEINSKNIKLDPEQHNCINTEPTDDDSKDGIIANIYQKGYKFAESNTVIRPATVSVYKKNK